MSGLKWSKENWIFRSEMGLGLYFYGLCGTSLPGGGGLPYNYITV